MDPTRLVTPAERAAMQRMRLDYARELAREAFSYGHAESYRFALQDALDALDARDEAVAIVLKAFEDGLFIRDTSGDHDPMWALRFAGPIAALARLRGESPAAQNDGDGGLAPREDDRAE